MNNKALYFTLLKNFNGRQMVDELIKTIEEADFGKTSQTAHALKGTSLNLGFIQLAGVAKNIETYATSKKEAHHLIAPLNEALEATLLNITILFESEGIK
jgi:HPt (histidine-containing phosphotransfer) domain-containing protein